MSITLGPTIPPLTAAAGSADPILAAFRAAPLALLISDPSQSDNPAIFINDAFTRLTGYAPDEIVGRNCRILQGDGTDRAEVARIGAALAAGEAIEFEILNYRRDGSAFWNQLSISPVRDESGALRYFVGSQTDVTHKVSAKIDLMQAKELLEGEVARRTRDLQIALDEKTALLHEVDHRVKNNLQLVVSLMLLTARRTSDAGAKAALAAMAERVSALSLAHRHLYAQEDVRQFDLAGLVRDLSNDLIGGAREGEIRLELDLQPAPVPAGKAAPLALLASELIGASLKQATPAASGRLAVSLANSGGEIRLIVEDDLDRSGPADEGFGKTLIEMLGRQLRASVVSEDLAPGRRATVAMAADLRSDRL